MAPPRTARFVIAVAGTALLIRVVRSRHRRALHPAGRSFDGALDISGAAAHLGSTLLDHPGHYRATIRVSKGVGTRGRRPDVRGLAVRVHLPARDLDLLLSTAGRGRLTRHLPMPTRTFDATYGSITAYRTGTHKKVYVAARPDPGGPSVGGSLDEVTPGDRFTLAVQHDGTEHPAGVISLAGPLPPPTDDALAFDPIRNALPDLHPTGLIHGVRAYAYRLSQRWRGATPPSGE